MEASFPGPPASCLLDLPASREAHQVPTDRTEITHADKTVTNAMPAHFEEAWTRISRRREFRPPQHTRWLKHRGASCTCWAFGLVTLHILDREAEARPAKRSTFSPKRSHTSVSPSPARRALRPLSPFSKARLLLAFPLQPCPVSCCPSRHEKDPWSWTPGPTSCASGHPVLPKTSIKGIQN